MRTEDDIRAAFRALAREAPDADAVLTAVRDQLDKANAVQPHDRRRGVRRPLAAVASVVAVLAVIGASIALAVGGHAPHRIASSKSKAANTRPGHPVTAPPYYLAEISNRKGPGEHAAVIDTATGATLATVRPPKPFSTFAAITGASDDRTFVLGAERGVGGAITLFRARFDPSRRKVTLTALPIPAIPAAERFDGLALSPSGSRLAVSTTASGRRAEQLSVYSLTTGAVKVWRQSSLAPAYTLSWGADGMLAYNWDGSPHYGVWLLNTATSGGGLIADSRLAAALPHGWAFVWGALLTPDGSTVVAAEMRMSGNLRTHRTNFEFGEFSAATGAQTHVLLPQHDGQESLIWTNPSGKVLVVQTETRQGMRLGVLSGGRLTPIPNPPAAGRFAEFTSLTIVF
jgi:hypothetical protein